ncbi:MAG: tetratricopeptide repeat protein [Candidatus Omnitrophica bacterium]|nr:tetratricopeptide repeat protein [Candidatus Omnitrophota bacterium]
MKDKVLLAFVIAFAFLHAGFIRPTVSQKLQEGNRLYHEGKLEEALTRYNDAQLSDPARPEILFNMGNIFYRQKKYQEAIDSYTKAMEKGGRELEGKAFYNIGNARFQRGQFREALDAYKQALDRNPDDLDTKYNLEYTERKIKEMLSQAQQTITQALKEQAKQAQAQQVQGKSGEPSEREDQRDQRQDQQAVGPSDGREGARDEEKQGAGEMEQRKGNENLREQKMMKDSEEEGKDTGEKEEGRKGSEELSKEDAERFLNTYEQSQKNLILQNRPSGLARRSYVEKDW